MVYKTNESIIVIQAEAINPIQTNVVFWSHDRGTAKLRFKLMKDNLPQSIPDGTTVPIRLTFNSPTAEGGIGKHDYLATVEDKIGGIVSIILQDNILGYQGVVHGSIYMDFPGDTSLDTAGRFSFEIQRSPIDDSTPELEDYYFNGFSQTIDKIEKILADGKLEIEKKIAESKTQIDSKLKDTNYKITKANQKITEYDQNLTELRNDMKLSEAWAWSADGTDRFTDKYPIDNLLPNSMFNSQMGWTVSMEVAGSTESGIANGEAWLEDLTATTSRWKQWQIYFDDNRYPDIFELIKANPNKRVTVSVDVKVEGNTIKNPGVIEVSLKSSTNAKWAVLKVDDTKISSEYIRYTATGTLPSDFNNVQNFRLILMFTGNGRATFTKPKLAIGNDGFYTPAPSEDYENAYPKYRGLALLPSDLPDDYSWDVTPEYTEKGLNNTVSLTEPQTVLGLKNFSDGIQIAGDRVVGENDHVVYTLDASNSKSFIDGYATFIKHGKEVIVNGTVKFKKAYAFGVPLDDEVPEEFIARGVNGMIIGASGTSNSAKMIYVRQDFKSIMTNSEFAINEWFTFNGSYWVGEE
ncbi:BppU family phage baseplate upper protein [Enterococcus faecium]|uniref:BppU family phage baseplate upper protein n=1 Tax=Enterococcus faecium TaxID=1352 RepID=UPI001E5A6D22|nr:BppU family phage baseplate upper protein [Enterococcus faecium]